MWKFTTYSFHIQNGEVDERVYYVNRYSPKTSIFYRKESSSWELVEWENGGNSMLIASAKSSLPAMGLGTNPWTIYNDSKDCYDGDGMEYTTMLTFSSCNDEQFTCENGNCVSMERRCDGKFDCFDKTDEKDCKLIVDDPSYSKGISPPPKKNKQFCEVFISVDILEILKLDEIGKIFEIKFELFITWIDPRLTYKNLKRNPNLNVFQLDGQRSIWTPDIIFSNTKKSEQTDIDKKSMIRVLPDKDFKYTKSLKTENKNLYYFPGSENVLELTRIYHVEFLCNYDMALFPFDTQTCSMNFKQSNVRECSSFS